LGKCVFSNPWRGTFTPAFNAIIRVPFAPIPGLQPSTFFCIMVGLVFGPRKGFTVGALTAFISNFFLGHGPWTLYQMFGWGIVGMAGGLLAPLLRGQLLIIKERGDAMPAPRDAVDARVRPVVPLVVDLLVGKVGQPDSPVEQRGGNSIVEAEFAFITGIGPGKAAELDVYWTYPAGYCVDLLRVDLMLVPKVSGR
jgi:hypothetical protein